MTLALAVPISENVITAGRDAWARYKAAQELGLDQLLDVGRALLAGRAHALEAAGADHPTGKPYIKAFRAWCAEHGLEDVPSKWRGDLMWCAERESEVRAAYAAQAATRSRSQPSINPRTMRQGVQKIRKCGPPKRKAGFSVPAMPIGNLCRLLDQRLAARDPETVLAEIAALAAVLEDAARDAQANAPRTSIPPLRECPGH